MTQTNDKQPESYVVIYNGAPYGYGERGHVISTHATEAAALEACPGLPDYIVTKESAQSARMPYEYNVAMLPDKVVNRAISYDGEKEQTASYTILAINRSNPELIAEPAEARCWMGRSSTASVVFASVWIRTIDGRYMSGRDRAGGGGYHKESAAIEGACMSAGVTFAKAFGGAGEAAVTQALLAIARACGYAYDEYVFRVVMQ